MLESIFHGAHDSFLGEMMRGSSYAYPLAEMVHLLGLAVVLGSLLLQGSRLLGFGMRRATVAEVTEDLGPWTSFGLVVMVASGALMFTTRASDLYDFRFQPYATKLVLLFTGVLFYYFVQRRFARSGGRGGWIGSGIALITLTAFFGAAIAALWVEFL